MYLCDIVDNLPIVRHLFSQRERDIHRIYNLIEEFKEEVEPFYNSFLAGSILKPVFLERLKEKEKEYQPKIDSLRRTLSDRHVLCAGLGGVGSFYLAVACGIPERSLWLAVPMISGIILGSVIDLKNLESVEKKIIDTNPKMIYAANTRKGNIPDLFDETMDIFFEGNYVRIYEKVSEVESSTKYPRKIGWNGYAAGIIAGICGVVQQDPIFLTMSMALFSSGLGARYMAKRKVDKVAQEFRSDHMEVHPEIYN